MTGRLPGGRAAGWGGSCRAGAGWGGARWGLFVLLTALLAAVAVLSVRIGSMEVSSGDVVDALFRYDAQSYEQTVVRTLRVPRTAIGLGVGAGLAVAGAAMQAATRNPLADPSILGINSGAAFGVAAAVYYGQMSQPLHYVWFAFTGGLAAAVLVYGIGAAGRGGATPVRLALAGVIVSTLLSFWLTALLLLNQRTLDEVRYWLAGSLAGRDVHVFLSLLPFLAVGVLGTLLLGHQLNVLSMDEDTARSLGMRTDLVRGLVAVLVVLVAGSAVAAAGPIGFIGLAVPHLVRQLAGPDYRWILTFSLVVGPLVLLGADIIGRVIARPAEVQVGVVTAFVGAPFLIGLARRHRVAEL